MATNFYFSLFYLFFVDLFTTIAWRGPDTYDVALRYCEAHGGLTCTDTEAGYQKISKALNHQTQEFWAGVHRTQSFYWKNGTKVHGVSEAELQSCIYYDARDSTLCKTSCSNTLAYICSAQDFSKCTGSSVCVYLYDASYAIYESKFLTWDNASKQCEAMGAELASLDSKSRTSVLARHIFQSCHSVKFWTGGSNKNWTNAASEPLHKQRWLPGEPGLDPCVIFTTDHANRFGWRTVSCGSKYEYLCNKDQQWNWSGGNRQLLEKDKQEKNQIDQETAPTVSITTTGDTKKPYYELLSLLSAPAGIILILLFLKLYGLPKGKRKRRCSDEATTLQPLNQ